MTTTTILTTFLCSNGDFLALATGYGGGKKGGAKGHKSSHGSSGFKGSKGGKKGKKGKKFFKKHFSKKGKNKKGFSEGKL
jgi:hypothetical protein